MTIPLDPGVRSEQVGAAKVPVAGTIFYTV